MELKGKIIKGIGGLYNVRFDNGTTVPCKPKGSFRHNNMKPYVGDDVTVIDEGGYVISEISERRNCLIRPPISNVATIFITFSPSEPAPVLLNIDKLTCIAEYCGIRPVIVITKSDIAPDAAQKYADIYEKIGYTVFVTGASSEIGILRDFIKAECRNGVCCFAGASGVGKSSIITRIFPSLNLETGEISAKISRGKNTTKHVELYPLSDLFGDGQGGYISDTPGFSLLDFVRFDFFGVSDLPTTFPEFDQYLSGCKYTKCTHLCEDGCAVCRAVSDGLIPKTRHESFVSMYNDLKNKHSWDK